MAKAGVVRTARPMQLDTLYNLMSGMGGTGDKGAFTLFGNTIISRGQLDIAYRNDWIARKVIDIPAQDATREWRAWQADRQDISAIEDVEKQFNVQIKMQKALQKARLYGGGAIIIGVNQGRPEEELIPANIKKGDLKFLHYVSKNDITAGPLVQDIMSPWYGQPSYYDRNTGSILRIHPSRVVRFIGMDLPDETYGDGWGDPVLQVVQQAIKAAGGVAQGVAHLVEEAKVDVIKIPDMTANISNVDYASNLSSRFGLASNLKSIYHMLLLDKEEEWERIEQNFSTLPDLMKMYLLIASGAADIPATRMIGQAPLGLNATGDSDTRNYYDRVATEQETVYSPAMEKLDEVIIRSALGAFPEEIFYIWNSLWQMDEVQTAEIAAKKAATFKIDVDAGVIDGAVLKAARENQLIEDGTYPGIETLIEELGEEYEEPEPMMMAPGDPANENEQSEELVAQADRVRMRDARKRRRPARKGKKNWSVDARRSISRAVQDALPRTLYVRRDVLNWQAIAAHYKDQGFPTTVGASMHVTLAFSRQPIDWMKTGEPWGQDDKGQLHVRPGGVRISEKLGEATALLFVNNELAYRWCQLKEAGAEWKWPDYQPHITISWEGPQDLKNVVPYTGAIVLGPEIFEEVNDSWADLVVEDAKAASVFARAKEHPGALPDPAATIATAIADSIARIPPAQVNVTVPVRVEKTASTKTTKVTKRDAKGRIEETTETGGDE